ncbi:MAG: hypothetical protein ACFFEF_11235 [Candidatus Thorarchaeota archaeon]
MTLIFGIGLILFVFASVSGMAWLTLIRSVFAFWLTILMFLLAVSAGMVSTFSFVSFVKGREIRNLMLILLGLNIVLWSLLFLITHPSSSDWSMTFADRDRNRTLGMSLVLVVVPTILLGSFTGDVKSSRFSTLMLILWGAVFIPMVNLWFLLSEEPVFLMTSPEGGVGGLTLEGMIISFGYLLSQIVAFIRFAHMWWKSRDSFDLSLLLALAHWIAGTFFIIILWNPLQIAELIWAFTIVSGFFLIAAVQFTTSILNPHKELEYLVRTRTKELDDSRKESEFYLNMWTHKMGNILQGIVTYLDILEHSAQKREDDIETQGKARDLTREAVLVNHQVRQLSQIKGDVQDSLKATDVALAINRAIETAKELLGDDAFLVEYKHGSAINVEADGLLELVFLNAIIFHVKNLQNEHPAISISISQLDPRVQVEIRCTGKPLSIELQEFLKSEELVGKPPPSLELFTIKMLMHRYNGTVVYSRDEMYAMNQCMYEFVPSS